MEDIDQLIATAKRHIDAARKRIVEEHDELAYESLDWHLRQFIAGLGEDLDK